MLGSDRGTLRQTVSPARALTDAGALVLLAGCWAGCLTGCDGADATSAAVREADIRLVEVAGGEPADAQYAEGVYSQVESILNPHTGDGPEGAREAASIILSSAQQGLAATATERLARLEAEARNRTDVIRGQIAEWSRLDAQARAAMALDATPVLNEIDADLVARKGDLEALQSDQRDAQARASDLQSQIDDLLERSAAARDGAGEVMLEMASASAERVAALAPRARELTLEADSLELDALRVRTQLEQFSPGLNEINARIDQLNKQIELLTRSRTATVARARDAQEDAQAARSAADRAADELRGLVSGLQEFRAQDLSDAFDRASSKARQAMQSARKASGFARESGSLSAARAEQAMAHLELRRSQAAFTAASVLDAAHAAGAPGGYDSLAAEARTEAEEAHAAAMSAFEGAARGYRSVRARGDAGTRLNEIADMLERYAQTPAGTAPDLTPAPEPADDEFGDGFGDETQWDQQGDEDADGFGAGEDG